MCDTILTHRNQIKFKAVSKMADTGPSKSDIEAVFQRLRAIPSNKVCFYLSSDICQFIIRVFDYQFCVGMFRLQRQKSYVVVGDVWCVHLPGLFSGASQPGRAHHFRALYAARHQLDMEAAKEHAARRQCERSTTRYHFLSYMTIIMLW